MEEEERPRKLAKLDHSDSHALESQEPVMSGALVVTSDHADGYGDEKQTSTEAVSEVNGSDDSTPAAEKAPETIEEEGNEAAQTLSKNQLKKLRRREHWEAGREWRKAKRREKLLEKRQRKRAEKEEAKTNPEKAAELLEKRAARQRRSDLLPVTFVLDCGFDELMLDKERISLSQQLTRSYSDNSHAPFRAHLAISSFDKLLKQRFDTVLGKTHEHWKGIRFLQEDFVQAVEMAKEWMMAPQGGKMLGVFTDKTDAKPEDGEIVYLSSDSPHTLTELKPYSTYIIGGLVDKNRHKGICYKRAQEKGIKTAKLPIGEYIQMAARQVLATNHVVEIMLRWLELGDWGEAFMQVIPRRKGGVLKGQEGDVKDQEQLDEQEQEEEQEKQQNDVGQDVNEAQKDT